MTLGGICYLVGAGPGDPMLITRRGLECLRKADIVFYDRLANEALLREVHSGCELVSVGKTPGIPGIRQEDICALLVEATRAGKTVVRLKGGDPFVFGRGGEELLALAAEGLRFEVVPGITSGIAAPAYAGIPVTHRGISGAVTFVTGHESADTAESVDWHALGAFGHSLCIYMGIENLERICRLLMEGGRDAQTPVAIIQHGSLPQQRCVTGTLSSIVRVAGESGVTAPAIVFVGETSRLRTECAWFEKRPLAGQRILILRPESQAGELAACLAAYGADVFAIPAVHLEAAIFLPPPQLDRIVRLRGMPEPEAWHACDPLSRAMLRLHLRLHRGPVVFTSAHGVEFTWTRLRALGLDARVFADCRLVAIGPHTADALARHGLAVDDVPAHHSSAGLIQFFAETLPSAEAHTVMLLRSSKANPELAHALAASGYGVDDVVAYHTRLPDGPDSTLQTWLSADAVHAVLFTSGTAVEGLRVLAGDALANLVKGPRLTRLIATGATAAAALAEANFPCDHLLPAADHATVCSYFLHALSCHAG